MADKPRIITSRAFGEALAAAGVIELDGCKRVVIDANADEVVRVYVERYGDERLLKVTQTLEGVEISGVPAPTADPGGDSTNGTRTQQHRSTRLCRCASAHPQAVGAHHPGRARLVHGDHLPHAHPVDTPRQPMAPGPHT